MVDDEAEDPHRRRRRRRLARRCCGCRDRRRRGRSEEDEAPITGVALEKASAVALEQTGEGRVTGTEVGDEDAFYEVEVTLADGSQVDVHLDRTFTVVDERDDADGGNDDQADEDADGRRRRRERGRGP